MSATQEQLQWANYQKNTFIKSAKVILEVYNISDNSNVIYFSNYDSGYSYNIIKSISSNANGSIVMNSIPNISFVFVLFSNNTALINTIETLLTRGQTMVLTYTYDGINTLNYSVLLTLESFETSPDGTTITINGVDKTINYLMNELYTGLIVNDSGTTIGNGVSSNGSALKYYINGIFQNYVNVSTDAPTTNYTTDNSNGLISGYTKAESMQFILQASMGYNRYYGSYLPAIPLYSYKQANSSDTKLSFVLSNANNIVKLNESVINYDNNKTDKYVIEPIQELSYPIIKKIDAPKNLTINVYDNVYSSPSSVPFSVLFTTPALNISGNSYSEIQSQTITEKSKVDSISDIILLFAYVGAVTPTLVDYIQLDKLSYDTDTGVLYYRLRNTSSNTNIYSAIIGSSKPSPVLTDTLFEGSVLIGDATTTTANITLNYDGLTYGLDSNEIGIEYDSTQISSITNIEYYNDKISFTATRNSNVSYSTLIPIKIKGIKISTNISQQTYTLNSDGNYDIEIDNPLITSKDIANKVYSTLNDLLKAPLRTLEIECRIDPSICLYSIIKVIDKLGKPYYVWVNEYNYIFNGGFTGTIRGLIVDGYDYLKIVEKPIYSGYLYSDSSDFDLIIYNTNNFEVLLKLASNSGSEAVFGLNDRIDANSYLEITPENAPQNLLDMIDNADFPLRVWFIELKDEYRLTSDVTVIESDGE